MRRRQHTISNTAIHVDRRAVCVDDSGDIDMPAMTCVIK